MNDEQIKTAATLTSKPVKTEDLFDPAPPTIKPVSTPKVTSMPKPIPTRAPYVDANDRLLFDPDELEPAVGSGYQLPGASAVGIVPQPVLTATKNPLLPDALPILLDPSGNAMAAAMRPQELTSSSAAAAAAHHSPLLAPLDNPHSSPPSSTWKKWVISIAAALALLLLLLYFIKNRSADGGSGYGGQEFGSGMYGGNSGSGGGGGLSAGLGPSGGGGADFGGGMYGGGGLDRI